MDLNIRTLERKAASGSQEAVQALVRARERADGFDKMSLVIDGETFEAGDCYQIADGIVCVSADAGGEEYIVALDAETAGKAARDRWADMAEHDPSEFRAMVGDDVLVAWALGQYAGPGSVQVNSLSAWLDLHLDHPEDEFASWDGEEVDVDRVGSEIAENIGFVPTVAYRHN